MTGALFPARFRKRPVEVEAVQFTGTPESCSAVTDFLGGPHADNHSWNPTTTTGGYLTRKTGAGQTLADQHFKPGCWIVKRWDGTFQVMRDKDFRRLFEEAGNG